MEEIYLTPNEHAVTLEVRPDTNDAAMAAAILNTDEYRLTGLSLEGWALDIGSHIGTVALALAVDNPNLKVIAIEPVPENCEVIRASIALNHLEDRVYVEEASCGAPGQKTLPCRYDFTDADWHDKPGIHDSRWVGNVWREDSHPVATLIDSPVITLAGLANKYAATFRFCKIDCEGCEVHVFANGAGLVQEIIGEFHDNLLPQLTELLEPTHNIEVLDDKGGIGMFRAVLR